VGLLPEHKQRNLGQIGYYVRPSQRNRGYGTAMMKLLMAKAAQRGLRRAMVICRAGTASARVVQKNGGKLDSEYIRETDGVRCQRYWVDL